MSGRYFAFCSSVPKAMITGATIEIPKAVKPGALAAAISLLNKYFCEAVKEAPPYSLGQFTPAQPLE